MRTLGPSWYFHRFRQPVLNIIGSCIGIIWAFCIETKTNGMGMRPVMKFFVLPFNTCTAVGQSPFRTPRGPARSSGYLLAEEHPWCSSLSGERASFYLSIGLSFYLFICLFIYLCICLSICLSTCLCTYLYYIRAYASIYLGRASHSPRVTVPSTPHNWDFRRAPWRAWARWGAWWGIPCPSKKNPFPCPPTLTLQKLPSYLRPCHQRKSPATADVANVLAACNHIGGHFGVFHVPATNSWHWAARNS